MVERVRGAAGDDEIAHSLEDDLYHALMHAIANGECDDPSVCATEALKTEKMKFARWCA
jgi:hypothetical protein